MIASVIDRRRARRFVAPNEHGIVAARVRPGCEVVVVNASAGGALVESQRRLLPGASVDLLLTSVGRPAELIRGEVLRCSVARLREHSIAYRGAIAFERRLWWFPREGSSGYALLEWGRGQAPDGHTLPEAASR